LHDFSAIAELLFKTNLYDKNCDVAQHSLIGWLPVTLKGIEEQSSGV